MPSKFCVISPTSQNRTWFYSEVEATKHATRLVNHSKHRETQLLVVEVKVKVSPRQSPVQLTMEV